MDRILLKISGEALKGNREFGIDPEVLNNLAKDIKKNTQYAEVSIVLGGGNFFRGRDALELNLDRVDCDYMGMIGTIMNSLALKSALTNIGVECELFSSLDIAPINNYYKEAAIKALDEKKVVIFAGGTGRPYYSTDTAALLKASDIGASKVLMGKLGVDGVYDSDPRKNPDAKKYDILKHREMIENKLAIMDLSAAVIADDNNIDIIVFNIQEENSIERAIKGEISHTLITK